MSSWTSVVWNSVHAELVSVLENEDIEFDPNCLTVETIKSHSNNSAIANPNAVKYLKLDETQKLFIVFNLLEQAKRSKSSKFPKLSWKQASDALFA